MHGLILQSPASALGSLPSGALSSEQAGATYQSALNLARDSIGWLKEPQDKKKDTSLSIANYAMEPVDKSLTLIL
jgi:hypothetical protein